jgi:ribosomal protein S15P/S13E
MATKTLTLKQLDKRIAQAEKHIRNLGWDLASRRRILKWLRKQRQSVRQLQRVNTRATS